MLFWIYSSVILLCRALWQAANHHHQHSSSNQQQQQTPNDPKQRQRNQGNTDRQADREGGGGARSPARPPLVFLCLLGGSGGAGWPSQHSRSVGPPTVAARSPAMRAPLDRRAEPVHAARNARTDARECGSCSRPQRRRSHSRTASRLARFDRHHHPSSQVPCRDTRVHSFAGRHFELVRRGSRGAAAPHHRLRNLTVASEIHDEIAVSRSGNCRLLLWAGAILRYSGCYSCAMLALFLRYSCVILALFLRYSRVILALFLRYSAAIMALFLWLFPRHHLQLYKLRRELLDLARLWLLTSDEPIILIDDAKERTEWLV